MNLSGLAMPGVDSRQWIDEDDRPAPEAVSGRRVCANPECTATWTAPWRSRRRPLFEEKWGCSGRCVLALVLAAIRRESANALAYGPVRHRHRMPLGLLLLEQGWITRSQLQHALAVQREQGCRIGEALVAECGVEPSLITRGLSLQWGRPVLGSSGFSPCAMALAAPGVLMEETGMLPLRVAASRILYLAFEEGLDASAALALEKMVGLKVETGLMQTEEYRATRSSLLECEGVEVKMEPFRETDAMAARIAALLEQKQPVASKLVRIHQYYWLRLWLETSAKGTQGDLPRSREDMADYVFTMGR